MDNACSAAVSDSDVENTAPLMHTDDTIPQSLSSILQDKLEVDEMALLLNKDSWQISHWKILASFCFKPLEDLRVHREYLESIMQSNNSNARLSSQCRDILTMMSCSATLSQASEVLGIQKKLTWQDMKDLKAKQENENKCSLPLRELYTILGSLKGKPASLQDWRDTIKSIYEMHDIVIQGKEMIQELQDKSILREGFMENPAIDNILDRQRLPLQGILDQIISIVQYGRLDNSLSFFDILNLTYTHDNNDDVALKYMINAIMQQQDDTFYKQIQQRLYILKIAEKLKQSRDMSQHIETMSQDPAISDWASVCTDDLDYLDLKGFVTVDLDEADADIAQQQPVSSHTESIGNAAASASAAVANSPHDADINIDDAFKIV